MESNERLGRYQLLRLVGTGGMGEVFLARQEGPAGFAKLVVVKRILRHLASDQSFVDMFLDEARMAAQLSHPNIVQIFELGHQEETYFIAMEYVHGRSVRNACTCLRQKKAAWPPALAAWIASQALQGLQHAHGLRTEQGQPAGLVHRDVSPENLLVSFEGNVKLADFGVAKAMANATRTGSLKGKIAYVAPEQIRGEPIDGRADLYSLAATLYELLTGQLPWRKRPQLSDLPSLLSEEPVPPRKRNARVPRELEEIVMTGLAKDRSHRFASAALMAGELDRFIRQSGLEASAAKVSGLLHEIYGAEAQSNLPSPSAEVAGPVRATAGLNDGSALHTIISDSMVISPPAPPRLALGVGGLIALALIGGVWRWASRRGQAPVPAPVSITAPAPPPPVQAVAPPPPAQAEPAEEEPPAVDEPPGKPGPAPLRDHPKRPALGRVRVRVNPWADVLLDGERLGTTPMPPADVPAGAHVITLRNKDLGVERRMKVRVRPGVETIVKADLLQPGDAPPGAR
jgi:serine/threonine protein kinase